MNLDEFVKKYTGKYIDFDGNYGPQCVDLYRQYCKEVLNVPQSPPVQGAADIFDNYLPQYFDRISNTPDGVPSPGDVVIFSRSFGPFGHVSVFLEGNTTNFTSFDQNYPTGSPCQKQGHTYRSVLGWLHPKGIVMADTVAVDKATFEKLVTKSSRWDEVLKLGYTSAAQIEQEVKDLKAVIGDKNTEIKIERDRAETNRLAFNQLLSEAAKALNTVQEINQVQAALKKADSDLDSLSDLQRQFAELQIHSKEQVEELNAEVARLKALLANQNILENVTVEEMLAEIIKRIIRIVKK